MPSDSLASDVLELYTQPTSSEAVDWAETAEEQPCHYLGRKCDKCRKSRPDQSIGTCSVDYGVRNPKNIIICPHRFLERDQIFMDCIHLLTLHEPGNELHKVPEVSVPGGSVDYFLVSVRNEEIVDFVGLEIQALDTTGTVWPERQTFLKSKGVPVSEDFDPEKSFGMNWKMTAKTTLMQLHHKVETLEHINKHLVLALQDWLFAYMADSFAFDHIDEFEDAKLGNPMHFHTYALKKSNGRFRLGMDTRKSTDSDGIAKCLGLQTSPHVEFETIVARLQEKISERTLLTL